MYHDGTWILWDCSLQLRLNQHMEWLRQGDAGREGKRGSRDTSQKKVRVGALPGTVFWRTPTYDTSNASASTILCCY